MSGFTAGAGRNMPKRRDRNGEMSSAARLIELEKRLSQPGSTTQQMNSLPASMMNNPMSPQPASMSMLQSPGNMAGQDRARSSLIGNMGTSARGLSNGMLSGIGRMGNYAGDFGMFGGFTGVEPFAAIDRRFGVSKIPGGALDMAVGFVDAIVNGITGGKNASVGGAMPGDWGDVSAGRNLEGVQQWASFIDKASKESGVPWQVIASVMGIESGGKNGGVSPAGATGLMQIMPEYWQDVANKYGGDLNDPWTNIRTAADILKHYEEQYGGWENAAGAYLAGSPFSTAEDAFGTNVSEYQTWFNKNMEVLSGVSSPVSGAGANVPAGERAFPVAGYTGGLSLHHGSHPGAVDIFADYGTPVHAITGGTATSGYSDIGGYWTMVQGDDGLQYYYAHMDKMGPNGRVDTGSYISGVSDTGNAKGTGAHLHLGIGNQIYSGTGPQGGAGDINVAEFLAGAYRT